MAGPLPPGVPRKRPNNARFQRTLTKHTQHSGTTTQEHALALNDHESSVESQKAPTFDRDRRPDGERDGGTEGYPQIRPPAPSHKGSISRTQLRSLARTHATQTQAQSKSISRFGDRTKACNIYIYIYIYILKHESRMILINQKRERWVAKLGES